MLPSKFARFASEGSQIGRQEFWRFGGNSRQSIATECPAMLDLPLAWCVVVLEGSACVQTALEIVSNPLHRARAAQPAQEGLGQ